jgi:hypothetical protein
MRQKTGCIAITLAALTLGSLAAGTAGATALNVGDTVTANGTGSGQAYNVITSPYAGSPANGTISPTSTFSLGNSFNQTTGGVTFAATGPDFNGNATGTGGPWNFQDDYYFALNPGASVQAALISNAQSNITDLQVRLIYAAGNTVTTGNPVLGAPAGGTLLDAWQTLNLGGGSVNFTMPAIASASDYILQVRGEVAPSGGPGLAGSYGGSISFSPVPLPAGLPLFLSGLGGLGLILGRRHLAMPLPLRVSA